MEWLVVFIFAVLFGVQGCPFRNLREEIPTQAVFSHTPERKPKIKLTATSNCEKTDYRNITPSKDGICNAYKVINHGIDFLFQENYVLPSDLFGSAVRLVFHDAGEVDIRITSDILGSDGCLSTDGESAGLTEDNSIVMRLIEPLWQTICDKIGRADFWALFGTVAAERAANHAITITYQYGRRDNVECEGGAGRLPDGQSDLVDINRVFVQQMGLTLTDAVTLLGAHSLGHMHEGASGYGFSDDGSNQIPDRFNSWDDTPAVLDNDYYNKIVQQKWKSHPAVRANQSQWRHNHEPAIMINPDLALAYPISKILPGKSKRKQSCRPNNGISTYGCKNPLNTVPPSTLGLCYAYAANNNMFLHAFAESFTKMAAVGYGGVPSGAVDGATSTGKLGTLTVLDRSTCEL